MWSSGRRQRRGKGQLRAEIGRISSFKLLDASTCWKLVILSLPSEAEQEGSGQRERLNTDSGNGDFFWGSAADDDALPTVMSEHFVFVDA